ncbi:MAG: DUF3794 domain-containing protein [Clostridiales bacterium]|nr:DUF3794 domain-containing protein [Clostridiales bacterium]
MAINYEKGILKVDQLVGEELSQHLIEGELIIPEDKPEIAKILDLGARVYGTGIEVVQDKVMVEGIICYNLLYIPVGDNKTVVQVDNEEAFTQYVEVKGAKPRMNADISFELEHVDYDIQDSKSLNIRTVLNIGCKVQQLLQLEVLREFEEQDVIQALREPLRLVSSGGDGRGQTIIREDVEIPDDMPSAVEVLRKDAKVKILERKVADNRVVAHGEIELRLLYQTQEEQEPIQFLQYEIPFNHAVEVQGAYQGMDCHVNVEVQDIDISLRQDIVGDFRILSIDMMLFMEARVYESHEVDVIIDAYSPGSVLDLVKEKIVLTHSIGEAQVQTVIRENVEVPENMPPVDRILYAEVRPLIADYRINDDQVLVDGVLTGVVIYKPEDDELSISSLKVDIPFSQGLEIEGTTQDMDCFCQVELQYLSHTLVSFNEFELKATLLVRGEVSQSIEKEVLLDVEEKEQELEEDSGLYIYFVQPGDTLWSVAKKYNTTINSILRYNDIDDQDILEEGTKLIVFKRLDTSIA